MNISVWRDKFLSKKSFKYTAVAFGLGLIFPLIALSIDIGIMNELPLEIDSIAYVHIANPLNFLVDLSPFVIGFISYFLGRSAEQVAFYSANLEKMVQERTLQLARAKNNVETILNSVREGLFIVHRTDSGYMISAEKSAACAKIFGKKYSMQGDFQKALSPFLSPAKAKELDNFLKLLRNGLADADMLTDLNPLKEIHTLAGEPEKEKYIRFAFNTVADKDDSQFLVSAIDVTEEKLLQIEVQEKNKKHAENTQMVLSVLHIGPALLEDFLEGVDTELAIVVNILQGEMSASETMKNIEQLGRSIHSIKGNASLLDLKVLAEVAHEFESAVQQIRGIDVPQWADFLPLAMHLDRLQKTVQGLKELLTRLHAFRQHTSGEIDSAIAAIPHNIAEMVGRFAAEAGKKVSVNTEEFSGKGIPNRFAYILRDIGIQMTRNSLVHGIENPEARLAAGKSPEGNIALKLTSDAETVYFSVRDDGRSFNFEKIREKAIVELKLEPSMVHQWDNEQLIECAFRPGFSTADTTTMTAGRGMGLDIVNSRIRNVGGKIRIKYAPGLFTEFAMSFPKNSEHKNVIG